MDAVHPVRRGYADSPFGQLHYAETGAGPVLLLLHQTPRSHDEFREVQPLLADGRRVVAMDMLGFGMSASLPAPLPLATRKLTITTSQLGTDAGIGGAIALASRPVFSVAGLARLLAET
jgi:pimeloyl-ACP methyl ester carboxylesterase